MLDKKANWGDKRVIKRNQTHVYTTPYREQERQRRSWAKYRNLYTEYRHSYNDYSLFKSITNRYRSHIMHNILFNRFCIAPHRLYNFTHIFRFSPFRKSRAYTHSELIFLTHKTLYRFLYTEKSEINVLFEALSLPLSVLLISLSLDVNNRFY